MHNGYASLLGAHDTSHVVHDLVVDRGDIVQLSSMIFYVDETEGALSVDVMRLWWMRSSTRF